MTEGRFEVPEKRDLYMSAGLVLTHFPSFQRLYMMLSLSLHSTQSLTHSPFEDLGHV